MVMGGSVDYSLNFLPDCRQAYLQSVPAKTVDNDKFMNMGIDKIELHHRMMLQTNV